MPIYEYLCDEDGTTIELLRPSAEADNPVEDPDDQGRTFRRVLSTFMAKAAESSRPSIPGGCCPCGDPNGPCGMG